MAFLQAHRPTRGRRQAHGAHSRFLLVALLLAIILSLASLAPPVAAGPIVANAPLPPPTPRPEAKLQRLHVRDSNIVEQAPAAYPPVITPCPPPTPAIDAVLLRRQALDTTTSELPTAISMIEGNPSPTHTAHQDPLLAIMPDFAFSMPAQVVVDGINLALVSMLSIHLLFTIHYHLPLSRKNYLLQTSSTLMLLINYSVHLHVLLRKLHRQSRTWPYMFSYIGTQIPPTDNSWTKPQQVFYLIMRAMATALAHLTHIQFLTLLFPSALEARLIFWMLGPLALAASGMEFTALSSDDDVKTSDLGDAIRNICNSTLYLLYTSALLIWGLLVNRRRAWRTDGGTAAFGCGSVGLAFINTGVSFVEIAFDRLWWLPDICWSLTVWQSWLGFWWWVGSGMGIGEVEDRAERLERRRKREERLKRKREREEAKEERARVKAANLAVGGGGGGAGSGTGWAGTSGESDVMQGIRRIRDKIAVETKDAGQTLNRRLGRGRTRLNPLANNNKSSTNSETVAGAVDDRHGDLETIELEEVRTHLPPTGLGGEGQEEGEEVASAAGAATGLADDARTTAGSGSSDSHPTGTSATWPSSSTGAVGAVLDWLAFHQPDFIRSRMKRLRMAHAAAARRAATEQTAIRDQVLNAGRGDRAPGLRAMIIERGAGTSQDLNRAVGGTGENGAASGPLGTRRTSAGHGNEGIYEELISVRRSGTTSRGGTRGAASSREDSGPLRSPSSRRNDLDVDEEEHTNVHAAGGGSLDPQRRPTSLRRSPLANLQAIDTSTSDRTSGNGSATLLDPGSSTRSRSTLDSEVRRVGLDADGRGSGSASGHNEAENYGGGRASGGGEGGADGEWVDAGEEEELEDEEEGEEDRRAATSRRKRFGFGTSTRSAAGTGTASRAGGGGSRSNAPSSSSWNLNLRNVIQGARVRDRERFEDEEDEEEEEEERRKRRRRKRRGGRGEEEEKMKVRYERCAPQRR